MSNMLAVIKFGGGLITDKTKPFTARTDQIERLAADLRQARDTLPDTDFLLGNGGGSFAHPSATKYGLRDGATTAEQFYGMAVTRNGVQQLNTLVSSKLIAQGLPAFSLSPSSMLTCSNGEVLTSNLEPLKQLLGCGLIPIVYGDTLVDDARGTAIFSTERVLEVCLQEVSDRYQEVVVIYVMNAPGVMSQTGEVLSEVGPDYVVHVTHHAGQDVTGGIIAKVVAARRAAETASSVYIIGPEPGALLKALKRQNVGTQIRLT